MRTLGWACALLFVFAFGVSWGQETKPKAKEIHYDELARLLEKPGNAFFLDVREPAEIAKLGTVKGYKNIPLSQLESRLAEVPKDKLIVTMCNQGGRASKAAALLDEKGYKTLGACGLEKIKTEGGERLITERPAADSKPQN
jgi:rhodanese-related sulfurtransferase